MTVETHRRVDGTDWALERATSVLKELDHE